jgi:hypothetical protein
MSRAASLHALRSALIVGALSLAATALAARDPLADRQCTGGVCMANVDAAQAMAPCANANLVLAWSQGGQAIALQCMTDRAPADQPILVFQKRATNAPAYELTGVRAFMPESLPQLAHVPRDGDDALLPACRRPVPPTMAPGELLLTEKVASDNERHPYCYRVLRVASLADGSIEIRADDGQVPVPARMGPEWQPLAWKMMGLVMAADASVPARVTRARAPLHDKPDARAAPHGWLAAGDRVEVVARHTPGGMVLVGHRDARGRSITRWIAQGDIALDAAR